jgi:hypothetical protein
MKAQYALAVIVLLIFNGSWVSADGPVVAGPDGIFYQRIDAVDITWSQARTAATGLSYGGASGQLATLLTQAQSDAADAARNGGECWLGGSGNRNADPDEWRWITGELFWLGVADGVAQNGLYTQWDDGEPNSSGDWLEWNSGDDDWDDTDNPENDCYLVQYNTRSTVAPRAVAVPTLSGYGLALAALALLLVAWRRFQA